MSTETRIKVCDRLYFRVDDYRDQLLDINLTNTYLIAMLDDITKPDNSYLEEIEVLSVWRTNSWGHSRGFSIDLYPKNWQDREQEAVTRVMKSLSLTCNCMTVGLGGITKQWKTYVTWPTAYFILFDDNDLDHLHAGCAAPDFPTPGQRCIYENANTAASV